MRDHPAEVTRADDAVASQQRAARASLAPPLGRRDDLRPVHGRDALVAELREVLAGGDRRVHVLHGMSGSGKSAVALEVVHHARAAGLDTWWVGADDEAVLAEHMRAVAHQAGVSDAALLSGHPADALWDRLADRRPGWLLVIDNADEPALLAGGTGPLADGRGWVRPYRGRNGTVLILTRHHDPELWGTWCTPHGIGRLDPADAVAVLRDHVEFAGDEAADARCLAERLGGLPLALRLAGAYLAHSRRRVIPDPAAPATFAGYLAAIESGEPVLRSERFIAPGRRHIDRPWSLSLDRLRRGSPLTELLLRLAAGLAAAPVPVTELFLPDVLAHAGIEATPDRVNDALAELQSLGLTDVTPAAELVLHPMVRDTARDELPCRAADIAVLARLVRNSPTVRNSWPDDVPNWPAWQSITPHALHLVGTLLDAAPGDHPADVVADACYAANYATRSMHARGLYLAADAELADIERLVLRDLGTAHPETLRTRHYRAVVLHARGLLTEAMAAYDAVYEARTRVLGPEDPETLRTRHYRAMVLHELGRHAEAHDEYEAVLALRSRPDVLGPDHRHTLATEHNLARLLHDTGAPGEAEVRYRDVLARQERSLGPDYRHALATRHNLALCLHVQGRHAEAWAEYEAVLDVERRLLLDNDPATLATRANMAVLLHETGRADEAARLREEVHAAQRALLGADHPDTLATLHGRVHRARQGPL